MYLLDPLGEQEEGCGAHTDMIAQFDPNADTLKAEMLKAMSLDLVSGAERSLENCLLRLERM